MSHLTGLFHGVYEYEDELKLEAAIQMIPFDVISEAAVTEPKKGELGYGYHEEDRFVIHLLKWFKNWFTWVNSAECQECHSTDNMSAKGAAEPTAEEKRFGANVTEMWECTKCCSVTRFPRYNDCVKLLETRQGRCGEWCNVMYLLLRALGRNVRYVWNSEDHVWNEVWSEHKQRWIHIDSCEAAFDTPLIYTDGWGKKMAYVVGFSIFGATDITHRYVRRPEMALPRTLIPELELTNLLSNLTTYARQLLDPVEAVNSFQRDESEAQELKAYATQPVTSAANDNMQPRQSGSAEWTQERGEAGL